MSKYIRRVDGLSKITIPKAIRQALNIAEGEPFEISVGDEEDTIVLKRYIPKGKSAECKHFEPIDILPGLGECALVKDRDPNHSCSADDDPKDCYYFERRDSK